MAVRTGGGATGLASTSFWIAAIASPSRVGSKRGGPGPGRRHAAKRAGKAGKMRAWTAGSMWSASAASTSRASSLTFPKWACPLTPTHPRKRSAPPSALSRAWTGAGSVWSSAATPACCRRPSPPGAAAAGAAAAAAAAAAVSSRFSAAIACTACPAWARLAAASSAFGVGGMWPGSMYCACVDQEKKKTDQSAKATLYLIDDPSPAPSIRSTHK